MKRNATPTTETAAKKRRSKKEKRQSKTARIQTDKARLKLFLQEAHKNTGLDPNPFPLLLFPLFHGLML